MHMRDLSKDDDFLSHLLVEKLGTGTVPLLVHKMDSSRRLPKTDTQALMAIVRRLVTSKGLLNVVVKTAVDELLELSPIRYYLKSYTQKQINAFATHASRYFELYHPSGSIEIAHTSRYSHHTGKSELCILATRNLAVGAVVTELKGSMANLTDEEDKELKRTDLRNSDIRRDFSVIHSKSMKKNHLFLGPARFVNHDCDNNCELFREGKYITFRVLRPIAIGEEITAHYGDGYFGKKNRHCLCETCEKNGRGGYSPDHHNDEPESSSDSSSGSGSDSDSDSDTSSSDAESDHPEKKPDLNINERRTRRGVYAVTKPKENDSDDSDNEDDEDPVGTPQGDGEIELLAELDTGSELTSLATSSPPSDGSSPAKHATPDLMTPSRRDGASPLSSSLTELTSSTRRSTPKSNQSTPFRSIIATRRQHNAKSESRAPASVPDGKGKSAKPTNASPSCSAEPSKRLTRSASSMMLSDNKGKGKATPTPTATPRAARFQKGGSKDKTKDEETVKKEEVDTRVLRARPSLAVQETPKESPKPDIPHGPDGKPLPTCSTCSNVLPLIAVDSKVVWGLGAEVSKKKKNVKQDCPRCLRHFAIYQRPWPSRVTPRGAISETPREETPVEVITKKVTHKGLSFLDRKLAAAASASASAANSRKSMKHARVEEEEEEEPRSNKRRKSEPEPVLQKTKVTKTYSSSASKKNKRVASPEPVEEPVVVEEPPAPAPPKRKRGRPRLITPPRVKLEDAADADKAVLSQPRSNNGRFGRKDRFRRRGRSMSSCNSAQKKRAEEKEDNSESDGGRASNKRSHDSVDDVEELPRKKTSAQVGQDEAIVQRVLPRPMSGFRGGGLFSNPNPLQYALHAWAGPVVLDDSSSDDEKHPETPDDVDSLAADIATPEEDVTSFVPTLTYKPSPFVFAKSRWNARAGSMKQSYAAATIDIAEKQAYLADEEVSDAAP
ncbi:hypothetical protein HYPSUDRAFT_128244 [Hypholoma sublateritium FD-334 SS-4]|uniref:SET domain-containing protein n=1 Tax=Hypholoma sublateritium (strain FD-334 SS-4) TaxID=945553 RepID=A0A0D2QBL4_HYPSF|nr:hypothetical protein HYPSUDRAFT_128244 [Hypholoma sublateritium FD-334 SS-4]